MQKSARTAEVLTEITAVCFYRRHLQDSEDMCTPFLELEIWFRLVSRAVTFALNLVNSLLQKTPRKHSQ